MDEIKSNKKAFGIYLGEPSTEQLNQFFYLHEKDLELINSKAGICFKDENLDLDNNSIIINREREVQLSNLPSSSKVLKRYKNVKNESL